MLVNLDDMGEVAKLGNVFFDVCNEFLDGGPEQLSTAVQCASKLRAMGCITSGGAWSGAEGKRQSNDWLNSWGYLIDILSHHRNWDANSFLEDMEFGKPVVWNEYFAHKDGLSLAAVKTLMELGFSVGLNGVQYYGFRDSSMFPGIPVSDPFSWQDILAYAATWTRCKNVVTYT